MGGELVEDKLEKERKHKREEDEWGYSSPSLQWNEFGVFRVIEEAKGGDLEEKENS